MKKNIFIQVISFTLVLYSSLPLNSIPSTIWAGYAATDDIANPTDGSVTEVHGRWIVPSIVPAEEVLSSYWVGIDGTFGSTTVEQIGTSHNFIEGEMDNFAWYETFPNPPVNIDPDVFPVNPGDVVSASVVYVGGDTFTFSITNVTQNIFFTVDQVAPGAERKSAEWIVEAPAIDSTIFPLANFTATFLWDCTATINGITAPINNPNWQHESRELVTTFGKQKAVPSVLLQDGSFFVTWKHE